MLKKIPRTNLLFFGAALLIFIVIQVAISTYLLNDFWSTIIRIGGVMAIVSLGFNLIYGYNGQFSLGQWGFYAIGAYTAADITYRWSNNSEATGLSTLLIGVLLVGGAIVYLRSLLGKIRGLDALSAFTMYFLATLILGIVAVFLGKLVGPAVAGLLMALPAGISLQIVFILAVIIAGMFAAEISFLFGLPVLTLGSDYFGIATLGFTIIVKVLLDNSDTMLGFQEMKGARGMIGIPKITTWFWVFLALLIVVVVMRNLLHSSYGRAIVSVREDEIAGKAMGIDVAEYKILAFVIGSFFAGLAGGLYAHINGFLHPNTFNFIKSFDPMIIIVLGGLGSITGTLVASFTWALLLEGVLRLVLPPGFETWRFVVYPLLLLLIMLVRPSGLLGSYEFPFLRQVLPPLKAFGKSKSNSANPESGAPAPVQEGDQMSDKPTPTQTNGRHPILEIDELSIQFGGLRAVNNFDLLLKPHDLQGLIGPNGAGKTTVFNMITGVYTPTAGRICLKDLEITGLEPHEINHLGIARTFQNIRLFPSLTVLDNVRIAYHTHAGYSFVDGVLHTGRFQQKERELTEKAQDFLAVFNLQDRQDWTARNLPYGEQRRLEIARALAAEPQLLLLDEPAAGMNPAESSSLMDLIHFIRERFDLTILLIEHQMRVVMGICEKITVMDFGEVIARGTPQEIQSNPKVIEAYLGPGAAALSEKFRRKKVQ